MTQILAILNLLFLLVSLYFSVRYHFQPTKRSLRKFLYCVLGMAAFSTANGVFKTGGLIGILALPVAIILYTVVVFAIGWLFKVFLNGVSMAGTTASRLYSELPEDKHAALHQWQHSTTVLDAPVVPDDLENKMWLAIETRVVSQELKNFFRDEYEEKRRLVETKGSDVKYSWTAFIDDKLNND